MREFKAELEERQSEVEELRRSLTSKGSEVERMNTDTSLYKQQYEQLLVEYNQVGNSVGNRDRSDYRLGRLSDFVILIDLKF